MDSVIRNRLLMAGIGAIAGFSLYALFEVLDQALLPDRAALWLTCFAAVFFTALLAMTGPFPVLRAGVRALALALLVATLLFWAGFRYDSLSSFANGTLAFLVVLVLATLPLPFIIAADGPGWRDYPTLFSQSWTILVRMSAAWVFVGVVWLVVFLSDALLSMVGVTLIGDAIENSGVIFVISGAVLGLGLAVVAELSDMVSPSLVLRLLRLLLPVVVVVMAVFLLAVPLRGMTEVFQSLSAGFILLAMAAAGITLVSTAVDQTDADAAHHPVIAGAARAVCLMLPLLAALGAWSVWQRVAQYGWTPERLFAATVAMFALAYGILYAVAVLRGPVWRAQVRRGNTLMAILLMAVAVMWLTPVLNAERISSHDQLARFKSGAVKAEALDMVAIDSWGRAGAQVRAELEVLAATPGQEALAARLALTDTVTPADPAVAVAALAAQMPLQPPTATATRDFLLAGLDGYTVNDWAMACGRNLPDGKPGCLMVVADLWPREPGEEAIVLLNQGGWAMMQGLIFRDGKTETRQVWAGAGGTLDTQAALALLSAWQSEAPPLAPVPLNQLGVEGGLILLP